MSRRKRTTFSRKAVWKSASLNDIFGQKDLSHGASSLTEIIRNDRIPRDARVVDGTRVPVDHVRAEINHGGSRAERSRHYPKLPLDGIEARVERVKVGRLL